MEGEVKSGMLLAIPLNSALDVTIPIHKVSFNDEGWAIVTLACDDEDGPEFVAALNFADETLEIRP